MAYHDGAQSTVAQQAAGECTPSNEFQKHADDEKRFRLSGWFRRWAKQRQERRQENGNAGASRGAATSLHRAVSWQAFFYLLCFIWTWPFYFASIFSTTNESYWFWVRQCPSPPQRMTAVCLPVSNISLYM